MCWLHGNIRFPNMPFPTWLPPLKTNDGSSIHVSVVQCHPRSTSNHSSGFAINMKVLVTYACEDPRVSLARLRGLSLRRSFHIPSADLDISIASSYTSSREKITNLIDSVPVPFPIDRFYWEASRFDGFVSTSILGEERDLAGCILSYLVKMRESNDQTQDQLFGVEVTINREAILLKRDHQMLMNWYDEQRRSNPTFESDYAKAISTPWTYDEAFYKALSARCVCPSINKLVTGEEYQGQGAKEECGMCFKKFVLGSRVARLPCQHIFHGICVAEWLEKSDYCAWCGVDFSLSLYEGS